MLNAGGCSHPPADGQTQMRPLRQTLCMQNSMSITEVFKGACVQINADNLINATRLCESGNKAWSEYARRKATDEFVDALSLDLGMK